MRETAIGGRILFPWRKRMGIQVALIEGSIRTAISVGARMLRCMAASLANALEFIAKATDLSADDLHAALAQSATVRMVYLAVPADCSPLERRRFAVTANTAEIPSPHVRLFRRLENAAAREQLTVCIIYGCRRHNFCLPPSQLLDAVGITFVCRPHRSLTPAANFFNAAATTIPWPTTGQRVFV